MDPQAVAKYLDYGLLGLTIVTLIAVIRWVAGRWQKAEDKVDEEKEGRLADTRSQAVLGVEFKNATLVMGEALHKNTAELTALRADVAKLREDVTTIRAEVSARSERRA